EDFCLITGFRFGKVNLDPDEEDHLEFRMRVFLKIENLKGEHLLELVNKDVKSVKLDDEDVVLLRLATKGCSKGKSFHTPVRTEVRHEVHVRTEVTRVYSKEEMIISLQVRLNSDEEKLKPGPLDVDHLDKLLELMLSKRSRKNTKCVNAANEELTAAKHKLMLLVYCC
nr:hypothetical protein [Tanacetum cinerariifolium]